jgi:hypothetical protein
MSASDCPEAGATARPEPDDPDIKAKMGDLHDWASEEYNYVLYTDAYGQHLYAGASLDLEAMR